MAEVRSGDVVVLASGLVVKLAGLDAPRRDAPYADQARATLQDMVDGREVELLYGGAKRDAYGRALAQVRLVKGRRWVQDALLRAGAARVRTYADNRALARRMLDAEARARADGKGLWRSYRVLLPEEVTRNTDGFQIVEGRVRRSGDAYGRLYLDFGADGRGFSVEIPAKAERDFAQAGLSPQALRGRLVRVRGLVSGEVMRLDHPEAVELLRES